MNTDERAAGFARRLGMRTKGDGTNEMSLQFPNGSRIVGLPGSEETIRGFSAVTLLLVDEASRVADELYMAVRPMLAASSGALWLMSTPCGKRGFFWETWERGGPEWERIRAPGNECARIERAFLEEERRTMGARRFQRVRTAKIWPRMNGDKHEAITGWSFVGWIWGRAGTPRRWRCWSGRN